MTANPDWVELVFDVSDDEEVDISLELPDTELAQLQALVNAATVASTQLPAIIAPAVPAMTAPVTTPLAAPLIAVDAPEAQAVSVTVNQTVIVNTTQITIAPVVAPRRRGVLELLIPAALIGLGLWIAIEAMISRCCRG